MAEEREPLARGQDKVGPHMPQANYCVMRMQLARMEAPEYYDYKAPFVSERPHEKPVSRC
jgi:hypothetical protein